MEEQDDGRKDPKKKEAAALPKLKLATTSTSNEEGDPSGSSKKRTLQPSHGGGEGKKLKLALPVSAKPGTAPINVKNLVVPHAGGGGGSIPAIPPVVVPALKLKRPAGGAAQQAQPGLPVPALALSKVVVLSGGAIEQSPVSPLSVPPLSSPAAASPMEVAMAKPDNDTDSHKADAAVQPTPSSPTHPPPGSSDEPAKLPTKKKSTPKSMASPANRELATVRGPPVGNAAGRVAIKRGLGGGDPRAFIRDFQAQNGLLSVPAAAPALQMLDVLGVPRLQIYRHLFVDLRARLEERVERCTNEEQLEKLLGQSFGYMTVPELRSIPERIIVKLRKVPPRFLDRLAARPQILDSLPMRVKQQAWAAHPALFRRALLGLVEQYVTNRTSVVMPAHDVVALLSLSASAVPKGVDTAKRRGENKAVAQLVECVNTEETKLEHVASRYLIDEYATKGDPTLCTLFADFQVLLAQARSGRATIITQLTHLARALDDWVREGKIEVRSLIQVQTHLRAIIVICDEAAAAAEKKAAASKALGGGGKGSKKKGDGKAPPAPSGGAPTLKLKLPGSAAAAADKAWSKVPTLEKALREGMNFLLKQDAETRWFAKPVLEAWPDIRNAYLLVVPRPMDLGTMKKKVKGGTAYTSFDALDQDAQLVFDNCMAFNAPGTPFYVGAERMKKAWLRFKARFKDVDAKMATERRKGGAGAGASIGLRGLVKSGSSSAPTHAPDLGGGRDASAPQPLARRPRLEGTMWGQALVLLADPFVLHVLGKTLWQQLDDVSKSQCLPKDHPLIPSLLQLLQLGLDARRQLALVLKHKATPPPPPSSTALKGGKKGALPPPPELPPAFSIPDARVAPLLLRDKDGEPAAENDVQEAARNVLPCCLELAAYVSLATKYAQAPGGWEGQPHDKDEVQEMLLEAVGRLYRSCKARQPSPLLLCLVEHALLHSVATADDQRTTPLAKTLAALLDHLHRKKRSELLAATPDPHDRALWISLASAGLLRVPKKKPAAKSPAAAPSSSSQRPALEPELRDLLLSLFVKQLPHVPAPRALSWCHEQVLRLLLGWMARGAFKRKKGGDGQGEEDDAVKRWVEDIVQGVGGPKAFVDAWEKERFAPMRKNYERLFEAEPWAKEVVLGGEGEGTQEQETSIGR